MLRCCCWRLRWWALDHTAADGEDFLTRLPSNSTASQPDIILCSVSVRTYFDTTGFSATLRHAQSCVLCTVLLACTTMFGSTCLDLTQVADIAVLSGCFHSCNVVICRFKEVYGTMDMHVAHTYRTRLMQCFNLQYKQHNVSSCQILSPPLLPVMCTCIAYVLSFAAASVGLCAQHHLCVLCRLKGHMMSQL